MQICFPLGRPVDPFQRRACIHRAISPPAPVDHSIWYPVFRRPFDWEGRPEGRMVPFNGLYLVCRDERSTIAVPVLGVEVDLAPIEREEQATEILLCRDRRKRPRR